MWDSEWHFREHHKAVSRDVQHVNLGAEKWKAVDRFEGVRSGKGYHPLKIEFRGEIYQQVPSAIWGVLLHLWYQNAWEVLLPSSMAWGNQIFNQGRCQAYVVIGIPIHGESGSWKGGILESLLQNQWDLHKSEEFWFLWINQGERIRGFRFEGTIWNLHPVGDKFQR